MDIAQWARCSGSLMSKLQMRQISPVSHQMWVCLSNRASPAGDDSPRDRGSHCCRGSGARKEVAQVHLLMTR